MQGFFGSAVNRATERGATGATAPGPTIIYFMQVEVDVKCMETNFGGHGISSIRNFVPFSSTFKTAKISLWTMDYSPWGQAWG